MSKFSTPFMRKSPLQAHQGPCWDGYVRNYDVPQGAPGSCKKKGQKKKKIKEDEEKDLYEVKNCGCGQDPCKTYGDENEKMAIVFYEEAEKVLEEALYYGLIDEEDELYEAKKKRLLHYVEYHMSKKDKGRNKKAAMVKYCGVVKKFR